MHERAAPPRTDELIAPGAVRVRRALLSVSDKRGIVDFARGLVELGVELVSTGGTARALEEAGLEVRSITDLTGFPEIMDGRVKTLHPKLYAGLLARRDDQSHLQAAEEHDIECVDLVCVNLYPFEETGAKRGVSDGEVIENIDIGGPTMIRAAAKNFAFRAVVVQPESYDAVLEELRESGAQAGAGHARGARGEGVRLHGPVRHRDRALVRRARRRRSRPVRARVREGARSPLRREPAPARRLLRPGGGAQPHAVDGPPARRASSSPSTTCSTSTRPACCCRSSRCPACAIIKHNNPCGSAVGDGPLEAYRGRSPRTRSARSAA